MPSAVLATGSACSRSCLLLSLCHYYSLHNLKAGKFIRSFSLPHAQFPCLWHLFCLACALVAINLHYSVLPDNCMVLFPIVRCYFQLTPVGITVFASISTTDLDNGNNKLVKYAIDFASTSEVCIQAVAMYLLSQNELNNNWSILRAHLFQRIYSMRIHAHTYTQRQLNTQASP